MNDEHVVAIRDVTLTYPGPPPVRAIRSATLTIAHGEYVALVGPSGSGKSSLLNLIGLLDRPTSGTYHLAGLDVSDLSETERTALRCRRLGFVFQAFHLIQHRSVEENVGLGLLYRGVAAPQRALQARAALEKVAMLHRSNALPTHLSGGEKQRVAIARALVGEPALLLCDEPTGNLDSTNADIVLKIFSALHNAGQTIIVITHDMTVAAQADRVISIRDGLLDNVTPICP